MGRCSGSRSRIFTNCFALTLTLILTLTLTLTLTETLIKDLEELLSVSEAQQAAASQRTEEYALQLSMLEKEVENNNPNPNFLY